MSAPLTGSCISYLFSQVKHPQKIDCGGGYIKVLPSSFDQKDFKGDTKYK